MTANTITTAPQAPDLDALYEEWAAETLGDFDMFLRFLTTPSPRRSAFIAGRLSADEINSKITAINIR